MQQEGGLDALGYDGLWEAPGAMSILPVLVGSPGSMDPMNICGQGRWQMPWWISPEAWQKGGA